MNRSYAKIKWKLIECGKEEAKISQFSERITSWVVEVKENEEETSLEKISWERNLNKEMTQLC